MRSRCQKEGMSLFLVRLVGTLQMDKPVSMCNQQRNAYNGKRIEKSSARSQLVWQLSWQLIKQENLKISKGNCLLQLEHHFRIKYKLKISLLSI